MTSKKELKQAYREMTFRKGVYQLRNTRNNKVFIGSSMDLDRAWNSLRVQLQTGNHFNEQLQRDWLELGEAEFAYEIVAVIKENNDPAVDVKQEVKTMEKLVMMELEPYEEKGYHQKHIF